MPRGDRCLAHPGRETETVDKGPHAAAGQEQPGQVDPKQPDQEWLPYPSRLIKES
jgi:hypothetical protein